MRVASKGVKRFSAGPAKGISADQLMSHYDYFRLIFHGRRYCLMRLGFGLNVVPIITKTIVNTVLTRDEAINMATSMYINENVASLCVGKTG